MRIYEILTPRQVSHAIAITHDKNNLHKTKTKFTHEDFSEEWKKARAEFISNFPVAEKMFSEEGSAPYQIRKKNVKLVAPSEPDQEVMQYLLKLNPEISNDDYAKGQIEINGRFVKIGKALGKMKAPQHILDQYAHDSFRKESDFGSSLYDLVISGNPLDVYGMSTGRPWSSCADMTKLNNDGSADDAAQSMDEEIHNHTHVVYLVTPGGSVRNNAIARRGYKLHVGNDNATLLPDTSVYEDDDYNIPIDFKKVADKYMRELFKIEKGVYTLASGLYKDGDHIVYDDGEGNGLDVRKMTKNQLYDHKFTSSYKNFG